MQRVIVGVFMLAIGGMLGGCLASAGSADDGLAIEEAAIRYQFDHNRSGQRDKAQVFCLVKRVGDEVRSDPVPTLMQRFAADRRLIRPRSQCEIKSDSTVADHATGVQGLVISIGAINWLSKSEATISGGYYEASESGSGNLYHLHKVDGKWLVFKDELMSIS